MKTAIFAQIHPCNIDFLSKIIEGYDNIGILSTINPVEGVVIIHTTEDTLHEIIDILHHVPFEIKFSSEETL